jgi:hypothetical protein
MNFFKYIIAVLFLVITGCKYNVNMDTNTDNFDQKIIIKKVSFDMTRFFSVNCDNFDTVFASHIETIEITDIKALKEFGSIFNTLKIDTSNYIPDVRAKIFLLSNEITDTLCLSKLGVLLNGTSMLKNEALINFVENYSEL